MQQIAANNSFFLILNLVVLTSGSKPNRNLMSFEISNMSSLKPPSEVYFIHWKLFKIASWTKKGKTCEINRISLDFYRNIPLWENATIPIPGTRRTQNTPNNGIFQTQVIPSSGILLCQIIYNAVILLSLFFPIIGISLSRLFLCILNIPARLGIAFPSLKRTWKISFLFDVK